MVLRIARPGRQRRLISTSISSMVERLDASSSLCENKPGRTIDVSPLAIELRSSVRDYTHRDSLDHHLPVKLIGILAAQDTSQSDAELYSQRIQITCQEDGLDYEICRVSGHEPHDVEAAIQDANHREDIHGILVYYPIFKQRDIGSRGPYKNRLTGVYYKTHDDYLRDVVSPTKDVEGLCHDYNSRWLFRAQAKHRAEQLSTVLYPCTALSVLRILENQEHKWNEMTFTIINRSEIFGRPLAAMLANLGATVYSVDEHSILLFRSSGRLRRCTDMDIHRCIRQSTVVISAVPSPNFLLDLSSIQPGTTVVNVSEYNNVDEQAVLEIPGVRFIPQVGKVTVAVLEQNLISLHRSKLQRELDDSAIRAT